MRLATTILCGFVCFTSASARASAPQSKSPAGVGNVTFLVGQRWLDQDDWEPLEEQTSFAIEYDHYGRFDPVGFEVGFSYAEDSGTSAGVDLDTEVWEIYAGARKTFSLADDRLHPYLAAGGSWTNAELDVDSALGSDDVDDDAFGFYLRAGAYYTFGGGFNLGVDYRKMLGADFSDSGFNADGDFDQVSLSIGYSF